MPADTIRCDTGKTGYASKRRAMAASRNLGSRLRAYFCSDCKAWHVTSKGYNVHRRHG